MMSEHQQNITVGKDERGKLFLPVALALVAGVDVLVGLDVLRTCKLFVDGPGGTFTLDF
jgi:hypothetical protein